MTQTPLLARTDTPIFDELMRSFRGPSTGLRYTELNNPVDPTPPSLRPAPKFVPQAIAHEDKIVAELAAVSTGTMYIPAVADEALISSPMWPNYNQQLAEVSAKAQQAVSGTISVKERRGIALVETPHHFPTKAEKDAETAEFIVPPLPAEPPTIGVRPTLSLIKTTVAPTREERLGLDRRSAVKTLSEKIIADVETAHGLSLEKVMQAPVDFHKGVLALAEEKAQGTGNGAYRAAEAALDRGAVTAFKEDDTPPASKIEDGLGTKFHMIGGEGFTDVTALARDSIDKGYTASLMAEYRSAQRVVGRMDHSILSGLHAAAEKVRKLGTDNPPMHPQDAADYDATFGGKYMQEPVEYVGSDTVEMALPMKE